MKLDPTQAGRDRKILASALRDLRKASGLSGERLARRCSMSQSKVSRIETGRVLPSMTDVEQILTALEIEGSTREELLTLAQVANTEYQDVRASVRRGLHHRQRELASLERAATEVRYFLPALITGLLQTPEYMQAAMNTPIEPATADTDPAIALKLRRQAVLHDQSKNFEFILTESAVRWRLCTDSVMAVQIDRLVSLSRLPNINIGIIPISADIPDGAYHSFVVYDAHLVTIELFTGQLVLRDPKDVDHYRDLFEFFASRALWEEDARKFLNRLSHTFRNSK